MRGPQCVTSCLLAFLLLIAVTGLLPAGALPDAGCSTIDPCELHEGVQEGSLQPVVDEEDHYRFTPPEGPVVIHIEIDSDVHVEGVLRDPQGRVRASEPVIGKFPAQLDAVAHPVGEWTLEVGYWIPYHSSLSESDYTIELEWVFFENLEVHDLQPGAAPTVSVEFTDGEPGHLEALYESAGDLRSASATHIAYRAAGQGRAAAGTSTSLSYGGPALEVSNWGGPAQDLHFSVYPESSQRQYHPVDYRHVWGAPATAEVGFTTSAGIEATTVWIAWNGTSPSFVERDGQAFYHTVTDMQGGEGTFIAGHVQASDLHIEQDVSVASTHHKQLVVDASSPQPATGTTRASVTTPGGETHDLEDIEETFVPEETGTWRIDYHELDGREGDRFRVYGWVFPFQTPWPPEH